MKRILVLLLIFVFMFASFGCGKKEDNKPQDQTDATGELQGELDIASVDLGFGVQWLKNLIEGFEKENPKVKVNLKTSALTSKIYIYLATNKSNPYDLIFVETSNVFKNALNKHLINGVEYPYEDLTEVMNSKPDGEDKQSIREKLYKGLDKYFTSRDGKIYNMPYSMTMFGFVYNYEIIDDNKYKVPKTTDELLNLCDTMRANSEPFNPVIWTKSAQYWDEMIETWWAQYEGKVDFYNYFYGKNKDGNINIDVLNAKGRLEALKTVDSIIKMTNNRVDPDSAGLGFNDAQSRLMEGDSAIMPVGAWIENEMSDFFTPGSKPIDYMKTPIISSIVETLEYRDNGGYLSDNNLSKVIDKIDNGAKTPEDVIDVVSLSKEDFNKIYEARNITYYENIINSVVMPSFSNAKVLGKEFLKYMYSDKGIEAYTKANSGGSLPVYYDYSKFDFTNDFSRLQKKRLEIMGKTEDFLYRPRRDTLLLPFETTGIQAKLGSQNQSKTPQQIFQYDIDYYSANNNQKWNDLLQESGLI